MKLQREPLDIDLYVVNEPLTNAERKEITEFIKNDKKKRRLAERRKRSKKKAKTTA